MSLIVAVWLRSGTDATLFATLDSLVTEVGDQFARNSTSEAVNTEAAHHTPHALPLRSQASIRSSQVLSPADHTHGDHEVCSRPRTKARSDTDTALVYKWVDENGQTHLSDTQPQNVIASVLDMGMRKRDFTYQITADGGSVPAEFPGKLAAGSKRIYDTWHFFLGEEKLRQSRIDVLLISGTERFNAYHAKVSPGSRPVNGFYDMANNQAVVKLDPSDHRRSLATTFHEVSHLITASHLGPTPPWLTEGLAEHFETMQVSGQAGAIHPNMSHIRLLQARQLPGLREFLAIGRPEWHTDQRDRNYAIAWSLIHFLLREAPGMYALQELVQQAERNFCKPFSAAEALNNAYPGGLRRLESDWRNWLSGKSFVVLQT